MSTNEGIGQVVSCRFRGVWQIAKHTWFDVIDNEILTRASAIAFGAMMAAVPFLALVITIAALVLPAAGVESKDLLHSLESLLGTVFPDDAHHVIEEQIARLHGGQPIAVLSVSLAITIWLASGLFAAVMDGLNRIYGVKDTRPYWKFRLTAIWMTIVQSVILLAAVTSIFAFPLLTNWVGYTIQSPWMAPAVTWFIIFVMVLASFALTFAAGPDVKQAHRWVTPGSVFGATIFLASTYGFRLYVQNLAHYDLTYGSLGGVMMLMFWLYISSLVLLVAGEVNKVCYKAKEWSSCGPLPETAREADRNVSTATTNTAIAEPDADASGASVNENLLCKGSSMSKDWRVCPVCGGPNAQNQDYLACLKCDWNNHDNPVFIYVGPGARGSGESSGERQISKQPDGPADASGERQTPKQPDGPAESGGERQTPWEPFGPTGFGC